MRKGKQCKHNNTTNTPPESHGVDLATSWLLLSEHERAIVIFFLTSETRFFRDLWALFSRLVGRLG